MRIFQERLESSWKSSRRGCRTSTCFHAVQHCELSHSAEQRVAQVQCTLHKWNYQILDIEAVTHEIRLIAVSIMQIQYMWPGFYLCQGRLCGRRWYRNTDRWERHCARVHRGYSVLATKLCRPSTHMWVSNLEASMNQRQTANCVTVNLAAKHIENNEMVHMWDVTFRALLKTRRNVNEFIINCDTADR